MIETLLRRAVIRPTGQPSKHTAAIVNRLTTRWEDEDFGLPALDVSFIPEAGEAPRAETQLIVHGYDPGMNRGIASAAVALVATTCGGLGVGVAHADDHPSCNFTHTCSWSPRYNGPAPDVGNTPGTYGGWTTNRVECSPVTLQCYQVTP